MHLVPGGAIDDRLVLAGIVRALMHGLAEVNPIAEDLVDRALVDGFACTVPAVLRRPRFRRMTGAAQLLRQLGRRADAQEAGEDQTDELGFCLVHDELAVTHVAT